MEKEDPREFDPKDLNDHYKKFHDSSSVGNPGCLWLRALKIKSYYQIWPFWWTSSQEKALLFGKNCRFISKPNLWLAGTPVRRWNSTLEILQLTNDNLECILGMDTNWIHLNLLQDKNMSSNVWKTWDSPTNVPKYGNTISHTPKRSVLESASGPGLLTNPSTNPTVR